MKNGRLSRHRVNTPNKCVARHYFINNYPHFVSPGTHNMQQQNPKKWTKTQRDMCNWNIMQLMHFLHQTLQCQPFITEFVKLQADLLRWCAVIKVIYT